MIVMTFTEVANLLQTSFSGMDGTFKGISIDSRTLQANQLFVAIKGENFDGHDYVEAAASKGAVAIIASHPIKTELPVFYVEDTILALGQLAHHWRQRFHATIFAITGGCGKTTSKAMLYEILLIACDKQTDAVLCSQSSYNNNIGVPLTLFHLTPAHRYVVLEMGMNHAGELNYLSKIALPDVAVITNIGPAHIGLLGSLENIAQAKSEIFMGLRQYGTAILNADDAFFHFLSEQAKPHRLMTSAITEPGDITARGIQPTLLPSFTLHAEDQKIDIQLNLPGQHNIANALAAATAAYSQQIPLTDIQQGLQEMRVVRGRLQIKKGLNGSQLIDDTYNANPVSAFAGASILAQYNGKKILVLGDMAELGKYTHDLHTDLGNKIAGLAIDSVFTLGEHTEATSKAIGSKATHFRDRTLLIETLKTLLDANTTVLFKGSRSMQMEKILEALAHIGQEQVH